MITVYLLLITIILPNISYAESILKLCEVNKLEDSPNSEFGIQEFDCSLKNLSESNFESPELPFNLAKIDFTHNKFQSIPNLQSEILKSIILANNNISVLYDHSFSKLPNLKHIDLSWNQISIISLDTFKDLNYLEELDFSHNSLARLNYQLFSNLHKLKSLDLSWNTNLNKSKEIQQEDFFGIFGLNPMLKVLKLSHCNLNDLNVFNGRGLQNLSLNGNNFHQVPHIPRYLKFLDMSENPVEKITANFLPHLFHLESLILEDMPNLVEISEYGLFGLPALRVISLQNSRKLKFFDLHAFGVNVIRNETDISLESLNLSGTSLKTFNSSIFNAFEQLKHLNLDGAPLNCDCELEWIKKLEIDVKGHCAEPENLRGKSIKEFECDWMTPGIRQVTNGFIIVGLLLSVIGGILLVAYYLMRRRPARIRQNGKIGSNSPYARITIEPNSAENHF